MKQITFATLAEQGKKRQTRREKFLAEMEVVVPWPTLVALIDPHYPKAGKGWRPWPLETMLRLYFVQQWFNLSDPGMEDTLYDVPCMRSFARLDWFDESMPDETTILKFRRLLEKHQLTSALMNAINATLEQKGLLLKGGTMVDATIIPAPSSTKNEAGKRDPEMHQTRNGNQWYFVRFAHSASRNRRQSRRPASPTAPGGMKIHVGADANSGLAHTVSVTAANEADVGQLPNLLREDDRAVFGDKGYVNDKLKRAARKAGVFWGVALKASSKYKLMASNRRCNCKMSSVRSRVEHLFRVIKRPFGYTKVRYRGLVKNAAQVFTLIGLTNSCLARTALMP